MKKLITILLATLFICTASYGATIKELLGGKKSIKLSCQVVKAITWLSDNPLDKRVTPTGFVGTNYFLEIKEKSFILDNSFTEIEYLSGINQSDLHWQLKDGKTERFINDGRIEVTDNYYLLNHKMYLPSKKDKNKFITIKIYRSSGKFKLIEKELNGLNRDEVGDCEKATENKL